MDIEHANLQTEILVQKLDTRAGGEFKLHKEGDVGFDLEVWEPDLPFGDPIMIKAKEFAQLPTGLKVKVGNNAWGCIRPRSSTFIKKRLFIMEGTIDCGYTGVLFIIAFNPNTTPIIINNGDRLAQFIPVPKFWHVSTQLVTEMPVTERGEGGFGTTGGVSNG